MRILEVFEFLKIMESKMQMNLILTYNYKLLVCVDDKFSKPFKSYFGKDAVYNFLGSMIEESKYYSDVKKNAF